MARVTVEDCVDKSIEPFRTRLLAAHRARAVSSGAPITVDAYWLLGALRAAEFFS